MSSKFLSGGGTAGEVIALLNSGTQTLDIASIVDQSLIPNLPVAANASKKLIGRQIGVADINFAVLSNPMTADLSLGGFSITNCLNINGITFANLVSNTGTNIAGTIPSFSGTSGKIIQDSSILSADLFLRTGGIAMTGDINANTHEIKGLAAIRPNNTNIIIGNTTSLTLGSTGNVLMGDFSTSTGSSCVGIGLQCIVRNLAVVIGKEAVGGVLSTVIGYRSSCGNRTDTIILGHDNFSSGGDSADIIGVNQNNSTPNSLVIGNGIYVNIRASNTNCDLGTIALPFGNIYANGNLVSTGSSKSIDNIVSTASTGVSGDVVTFSAGKVVQDSGILLSSLATTASLSAYLLKAGGTMSGVLNMGAQEIQNVSAIRTNASKVVIGTGAVGSGTCTIIGNNCTGSDSSTIVGISSVDVSSFAGNTSLGRGNNTNGTRIVSIGQINTSAVNDALMFGNNLTNSTANSMLIGSGGGLVNFRPDTNNTCDLGTTTNRFKDGYINSLIGSTVSSSVDTLINNVTSNSNSITGLQSSTQNTYPRGASDSWTNVNPANSQVLVTYAPEIATMVGGSSANGVSYSLNNGTTWTSVALGAFLYVVGWSGALFVALSVGTATAYSSPNGVTWTLQAAPPFSTLTDTMRIFWSSLANLFICGTSNGASGIQTSPNGVTWTAQTSTRAPFRLANSSSIIVGATATGFVYSTNGTTWTNTADSFNCRTVVYSNERKEFIACSASTTTSYRSTDGITWTAFATTLPSAVQELNWTPSISKYWFAAQNPSTLLYSLYYSSNGITSFLSNPNMIDATNSGTLFYSSFFSVPLNRFYIFSNNAPQIHYADSSTITSFVGGLIINNSIDSAGLINIGSTTATGISIGRSTITTQIVGPLSAVTPTGSWYSSTSYLPLFGAGTARLIPPTVSSNGSLTNFTYAAGVLTCTCPIARDYRISYNISYLSGVAGTNMTFFNAKNGSLVIGAQTRQFQQIYTQNAATRMNTCFTDNIILANGDTVQLAGICAAASGAVSLDFVSCNIISTLS